MDADINRSAILKFFLKPQTCSNELQIKISNGCFLSSFKLFFFSFWHVSD